VKLIFVAGAWGSGTTAVAGALAELGVAAFGPHFQTSDPRTPNSFELVAFRDLVLRFVDERNISFEATRSAALVADLTIFRQALEAGELGEWPARGPKRLVLKLPVASLCLPQLAHVFDTTVIVVHRPLAEIEASRVRRGWSANLGAAGARAIYSKLFSDLTQLGLSNLGLSYRDITAEPERSMRRVIDFCGLEDLAGNLPRACAFIRGPDKAG
jgi:hypothetical protein